MAMSRLWGGLATSTLLRQTVPRLALLFVLLSAAFQYYYYARQDPYKCGALLNAGGWSSTTKRPYERWEPGNCIFHEYSRDDFRECLGGQRVVFAGDSTMRQLYWMAANRLDHVKEEVAILDFHVSDNKQRDLAMEVEGIQLEFIWDPWLNSTRLHDQLAQFRPLTDGVTQQGLRTAKKDSAALLVLGAPGLWAARHGGVDYLQIFRQSLQGIEPYLKTTQDANLGARKPPPRPSYDWLPNHILLAPVREPLYEHLSTGRRDAITKKKIDGMNSYLYGLPSAEQSHILWAFNKMIRGQHAAYNEDGLHVTKAIGGREISLILNARCNAGIKKDEKQSHPTCCIPHRAPNTLQTVLLLLGLISVPLVLFRVQEETRKSAALKATTLVTSSLSLASLLAAAAFCYVADRTHIFLKVERVWSSSFVWLFLGFLVASLGSVTKRRLRSIKAVPHFLPREQTDEWKGWMQAFVLLYDYYDGGQSLSLYKLLRLFIAVYIFLSVYGHTMYFLNSADFSLRRFGAVLVRLNLMDCLLSFVLLNSWTSYWFVPVATFWFCLVYLVLTTRQSMNGNLGGIMLKTLVAALLVNLVILIPGIVEYVCMPIHLVFRTAWDAGEMRSHLAGDRLTPFFAIILAATARRITQIRNGEAMPNSGAGSTFANSLDDTFRQILNLESYRTTEPSLWPVVSMACALLLLIFTAITQPNAVFRNQDVYNTFHPFLSWIPVICIVYLRNCLPALKGNYLALPAALGGISLESYILHHHIWLANRSFSLLRIWPPGQHVGLVGKLLDFVQPLMLTIVFLWAAARCREATQAVVDMVARISEGEDVSLEKPSQPLGKWRSRLLRDPKGKFACLLAVLWVGNMIYGT